MILFRDVVKQGIYHRFLKRHHAYYMLIDYYEETIIKSLGQDFASAKSSFHYFNMLFCATYDTDGEKEYLKYVHEYLGATIKRRLSKEEVHQLMMQENIERTH